MEHKTISFEIKALDGDGRTLEGFCAAFGNIDQVGDVIHPGAFRKTLTERGGRIKFLWQHDPTEPIGRLVEAREDTGGLYVKAVISDTARGRDAIALLRDGAIGEMSIGYDAVKGGTDYSKTPEGKSVRNLREIKLYEFSLVTFPANEQAIVTALKQQDKMDFVSDDQRRAVFASLAESGSSGDSDSGGYVDKIASFAAHRKLSEEERNKFTEWVMREYGDDPKWVDSHSLPELYNLFKPERENPFGTPLTTPDYARRGKSFPPETDADEGEESEPDAEPEIKAGRTISAATRAKLMAARDVIDELCRMGEGPEDNETEEAPAPEDKAAEEQEHKAGPVSPPTSTERLLKLIELELTTLEV